MLSRLVLLMLCLGSVVASDVAETPSTESSGNDTDSTVVGHGFSVEEETAEIVTNSSLRGSLTNLAQFGNCQVGERGKYCGNFKEADESTQWSLASCQAICKSSRSCTGGYYWGDKKKCFLFGTSGASAEICQDVKPADASSFTFSCTSAATEKITCERGPSSRSCSNFARAAQSIQDSLSSCEAACRNTPKCSGGYFWGEKKICYLFGTPDARDSHCGPLRSADASSTTFRCNFMKVKLRPSTVPNCVWSFSDCGTCRCVPIFICPFCG